MTDAYFSSSLDILGSSLNVSNILYTDNIQERTTNASTTIYNSVNISQSLPSSLNLNITNSDISSSASSKIALNTSGTLEYKNVDNTFHIKNGNDGLIINNSGDINITSGRITIQNTTDTTTSLQGSIVSYGGGYIDKNLFIGKKLKADYGEHELTNTSSSESVLVIKNTDSTGSANINVKNYLDTVKISMGFNNPLSVAEIKTNNTDLYIKSNNTNIIRFNQDTSINIFSSAVSASATSASVMLEGGMGINTTTPATSKSVGGALTLNGGLAVGKNIFIGTTMDIFNTSAPINPNTFYERFYVENGLFKSLSPTGVLTTYQPLNTLGDILIHDGTTQARVPIGRHGTALIADYTQPLKLRWKSITTDYIFRTFVNKHPSIGSKFIEHYYTGNTIIFVNGLNINSVPGFYVLQKNNPNSTGSLLSINNDTEITWGIYSSPILKQKNIAGLKDSEYILKLFTNDIIFNFRETTQLTGTQYGTLDTSNTTGQYWFLVWYEPLGASINFIASKNTVSSNGIINVILSSISGSTQLSPAYNANEKVKINKNNSNFDGDYYYYDILNNDRILYEDITLTGTAYTTIIAVNTIYSNACVIVAVLGSASGAPGSIFIISKGVYNSTSLITYLQNIPGQTGELISAVWNTQETIKIKKSNNNYNGTYKCKILASSFF